MNTKKILNMAARCGINIVLLVLMGCATTHHPTVEPMLSNLKGWNDAWITWRDDGKNIVQDADINGEVGHPMRVAAPTARVSPPGPWTWAYIRTVSGSFPPGLTMDGIGWITGIPRERGHWIVKLEMGEITAAGKRWSGFTQELRFHITGSGKVVD